MMKFSRIKRYSLASFGAVAIFALAACTSDDSSENTPAPVVTTVIKEAESTATAEQTSPPSATGDAETSEILTALSHAEDAHDGGFIVQIEKDDSRGSFDIDLVVGSTVHTFEVDTSGVITDEETGDDTEEIQKASDARITARQAIIAAAAGRDGETVTDADLEREEGTLQWEIEFENSDGSDGSTYIDALSGEVIGR